MQDFGPWRLSACPAVLRQVREDVVRRFEAGGPIADCRNHQDFLPARGTASLCACSGSPYCGCSRPPPPRPACASAPLWQAWRLHCQ
jgi:hypothetical protein